MILCDREIINCVKGGRIVIEPFRIENVSPTSYDVTLDSVILVPNKDFIYSLHWENEYDEFDVSDYEGILLIPGFMDVSYFRKKYCDDYFIVNGGFLGITKEYIELPNDICAQFQGRSSLGRMFLEVHQTAGWIDAGFKGKVVVEIVATTVPVLLKVGDRIGQLIFFRCGECNIGYDERKRSKYKKQVKIVGTIPDIL